MKSTAEFSFTPNIYILIWMQDIFQLLLYTTEAKN